MKTTIKAGLSALVLLSAISCTKENTSFQTLSSYGESSTQVLSSSVKELAGAQALRIGTQVWKVKDLGTSFIETLSGYHR